ncbi:MAG: RNA polymerase I enhancer binding protein [Sporothrix epigloea]
MPPKQPVALLRKRSLYTAIRPQSSLVDTHGVANTNNGNASETSAAKQETFLISPRVGKLAFEMPRSESRKNLELNVQLFQRQSLLLAAKLQIEGDYKRQKLAGEGHISDGHHLSIRSTEKRPSGKENQDDFEGSRYPSRRSHVRSTTQPDNGFNDNEKDAKGGFGFREGLRRREASLASQPDPHSRTASGIASTHSLSDNGRSRADSTSSTGGGFSAHAVAAEFTLPYVPDGADVESELILQQSAVDYEQQNNCSRVQANQELYEYAEGRLPTIDCESAHQLALQEQVMVEVNKQNGTKSMGIAKKYKQPGASASASAGAAMAIVLPDRLPPPPSAISKAWSSLKKGTGKMLLTRKSTLDLREVAEKMAPPPPPFSQRGDSNNTIENSDESDDSCLQKPEAKVNGQVRHLTGPSQKDKKLSQEEMWDLLSIRPPKKRPLKLKALHIPTADQDWAPVATKNSARGLSFCETGPISPPPQSPLPPLPLSRAASRSNETGDSTESNSITASVNAGDMISIQSSQPSGSSDIFDEYLEHECQPKTSPVFEDEGATNVFSETVASSPESNVARGSRGARTGSSIQQLEELSMMLNGVVVEDKLHVLVDENERQSEEGATRPTQQLSGEPN